MPDLQVAPYNHHFTKINTKYGKKHCKKNW